VPIVASTATYTITPSNTDAQILAIQRLIVDGERVLYPSPLAQIQHAFPDWDTDTGTPQQFIQRISPDTLTLVPVPDEAASFVPECVYAPTQAATTVPDELYDRYRDPILYGALAEIFGLPATTWQDVKAASKYRTLAHTGYSEAKLEVQRGTAGGATRVQYHPFI